MAHLTPWAILFRPRAAESSLRSWYAQISAHFFGICNIATFKSRTPPVKARLPGREDGYNVDMIRTEHVLDSWRTIREDTIRAVEDFPANEFDFRATPDMQTFGEIARHILQSSEGLTGMLLAGEEDFTVPDFRQRLARHIEDPAPGVAGLTAALRGALNGRLTELAARPADFWAREITRFDGQRLTRLEMVQFIKEHELTHRSQLFVYLRLKGIVPATTRRRLAKAAQQTAR